MQDQDGSVDAGGRWLTCWKGETGRVKTESGHVKEQISEEEEMEISNKVINQKWQNKVKVVQIQETW